MKVEKRDTKVLIGLSMQQRHAKKRQDIQCLRALAIVGVLGFHLHPTVFPSGYLGVDVFFVISGYLMTSILNYDQNPFTKASIYQFYTRRIKRIFPPYLLMILLTVLICQCYLLTSDWQKFRQDAYWALGFGTNIQSLIGKHEYFTSTQQYKFLLHAWSLGVEIQYYVIAPFLLYVIAMSKDPLSLSYYIIVASWALQSFCVSETVAFGFAGCRLWQFLFGTVAFYLGKMVENKEMMKNKEEDDNLLLIKAERKQRNATSQTSMNLIFTLVLLLLITVVCLPYFKVNDSTLIVITRLLATTLTSIVIILASTDAELSVKVPERFSNGIAFLGDMSYSIYLIHWPMIVLAKYLLIFDLLSTGFIVIAIMALSYFQFNFVEQPLAKQSGKVVYIIIITSYVATLMILLTNFNLFGIRKPVFVKHNENIVATCEADLWQLRNNCTMHLDFQWNKKDKPIDSYFCSYEGTGNMTILLTGNSFVMRFYHTFIDEARHLFKNLYVATQSMCTVFIKENEPQWMCNHISNELPRLMELLKPDVSIVTQRLSVSETLNAPLDSMKAAENDSMVEMMADYWNLYSKFTKKIVVIEPNPTWYNSGRESFVKLLQLDKSLESWHIPTKTYEEEVDPGWWRTLASIKTCSKCEAVPIRSSFCNTDMCDMYDVVTKESLFCDEGHLSSVGIRRFMNDVKLAMSCTIQLLVFVVFCHLTILVAGKHFTIYTSSYYQGDKDDRHSDDHWCHDFPKHLLDSISSIDTRGHCVAFFPKESCRGDRRIFKTNCAGPECCKTLNDFSQCGFNDMARSFAMC